MKAKLKSARYKRLSRQQDCNFGQQWFMTPTISHIEGGHRPPLQFEASGLILLLKREFRLHQADDRESPDHESGSAIQAAVAAARSSARHGLPAECPIAASASLISPGCRLSSETARSSKS